jgi:cbb3-type cytochrome oxidase maturation protein
MEILYLLIPLSVVLAFLAGGVFLWMSHSGQFDDLDSPDRRILMDDDRPKPNFDPDQHAGSPPQLRL